MTPTLTKSDIQALLATDDMAAFNKATCRALCTLALVGLAVQRRPLSEIEDDIALAIDAKGGCYLFEKAPNGKWFMKGTKTCWPNSILAFSLSSLPTPKEPT